MLHNILLNKVFFHIASRWNCCYTRIKWVGIFGSQSYHMGMLDREYFKMISEKKICQHLITVNQVSEIMRAYSIIERKPHGHARLFNLISQTLFHSGFLNLLFSIWLMFGCKTVAYLWKNWALYTVISFQQLNTHKSSWLPKLLTNFK